MLKIIKTSKHNINDITNNDKLTYLNYMFDEYKICLEYYINDILSGELPLVKKMSSKLLPTYNIKHSKYKRDIYKYASEIIRSQIKRASNKRYKKYKHVYKYYIDNKPESRFSNMKFKDLNLNDIIYTKYFTKPNINNITISLYNDIYDIKDNDTSFDNFIALKLPFMNEKGTRALKINIPLKYHRHSNKLFKDGYILRNTIQLKSVKGKIYVNLIWYKDIPSDTITSKGDSIGIDMGYKKLITTSNGDILGKEMVDIYEKISRKVQGSKAFKRSLIERDNMINYYLNQLEVDNLSYIFVEDLKDVKKNSSGKIYKKFNNKLQRWSYNKCILKLESICNTSNISLVKVSPSYTSQICSNCGSCNKSSRNKEDYNCIECGYKIDADINAAINIHDRGVYSLSNQ